MTTWSLADCAHTLVLELNCGCCTLILSDVLPTIRLPTNTKRLPRHHVGWRSCELLWPGNEAQQPLHCSILQQGTSMSSPTAPVSIPRRHSRSQGGSITSSSPPISFTRSPNDSAAQSLPGSSPPASRSSSCGHSGAKRWLKRLQYDPLLDSELFTVSLFEPTTPSTSWFICIRVLTQLLGALMATQL